VRYFVPTKLPRSGGTKRQARTKAIGAKCRILSFSVYIVVGLQQTRHNSINGQLNPPTTKSQTSRAQQTTPGQRARPPQNERTAAIPIGARQQNSKHDGDRPKRARRTKPSLRDRESKEGTTATRNGRAPIAPRPSIRWSSHCRSVKVPARRPYSLLIARGKHHSSNRASPPLNFTSITGSLSLR